jgi:hypothetical protein
MLTTMTRGLGAESTEEALQLVRLRVQNDDNRAPAEIKVERIQELQAEQQQQASLAELNAKHGTRTRNASTEDKEEQDQNKIMMTFEVIKFNTFVYTPYILVNTTNIPIYFGEKGSKMNEAKYIAPHSNEFFNPESSKKKKFTVAVEDYDWAEPFDISTLGMAGEASMKRKKDPNYESDLQRKFNSNNLNLGILISALSAPFGKTISVKFVPRYVFMNHCKVPLMLAQDYED